MDASKEGFEAVTGRENEMQKWRPIPFESTF